MIDPDKPYIYAISCGCYSSYQEILCCHGERLSAIGVVKSILAVWPNEIENSWRIDIDKVLDSAGFTVLYPEEDTVDIGGYKDFREKEAWENKLVALTEAQDETKDA